MSNILVFMLYDVSCLLNLNAILFSGDGIVINKLKNMEEIDNETN